MPEYRLPSLPVTRTIPGFLFPVEIRIHTLCRRQVQSGFDQFLSCPHCDSWVHAAQTEWVPLPIS